MKRSFFTRLLSFLLAMMLFVGIIPSETIAYDSVSNSEEQAEASDNAVYMASTGNGVAQNSMVVSVSSAKIKVSINKIGKSGDKADLYRFEANQYFETDEYKGYCTDKVEGTFIGTYDCGTEKEFEFNRYSVTGSDNLYSKYYLIQNGKILAGPVYATEIDSLRSVPRFDVDTKKGIAHEDNDTFAIAKDFGASNTVVNIDLGSLIYRNEDENGNPVDNSKLRNVIEFESNGETFYFDATTVRNNDGLIATYSKMGINVSLVIITWYITDFSKYPSSLAYNTTDNHQTIAFNTSNDRGLKYFIACMEFLASRYTKSKDSPLGFADKFIIGNEIDYTYDWYLIGPEMENGKYTRVDFDIFMEEFARTFRAANLAVKKYNSESKVVISLTHNWAKNRQDVYTDEYMRGKDPKNYRVYNSYAPKEILDWMNTVEKSRGDYDWALSVHPYPIGTESTNPTCEDLKGNSTFRPVTGDWQTSPWITCSNLELYQQYLETDAARYKGQVREVCLTETSICCLRGVDKTSEAYKNSLNQQAATIAQYYYRAASLDCISEITYFRPTDIEGSYQLGLMESDGTKKPSYNLWKYIDTNLSYNYSNKYLKYIGKGVNNEKVNSYKELMSCTDSGFDWDKVWSDEKIMPRTIASSSVERTIKTNKTSYGKDEGIFVTATGAAGDMVGIYKANDTIELDDPIYSFELESTAGSLKIRSGKEYNLIAYGDMSSTRAADAVMKAGDYVVAIRRGDTGAFKTTSITITENYSIGSTTASLSTDKESYRSGEGIVVSASGPSSGWVGLYKTGDVPGKITSIYWYWNNDPANGHVSGKPTVIQSTTHNGDSSNPSAVVKAGEYIVYLFGDGGYSNVLATKAITVEEGGAVSALDSLQYVLDNNSDGYANGTVKVKKDPDDDTITDCVMYWADANGKPLEGYTSLAMFKLEEEITVHRMYDHTIIPEGAVKLIAYASNGVDLSDDYLSVELPSGCQYKVTGTAKAEWQLMSDIHVTTDAGATGEVKLSNVHFQKMLQDVKANSPDSIGIFINGDLANTGIEDEYIKIYSMWREANTDKSLPNLHVSIGNHDWYGGNPNKLFQKYVRIFNNNIKSLDKVYYDEVVGGYHFIYLGMEEKYDGLRAVLYKEQLEWLDSKLDQYTSEDPDQPIFVFLHQAFYNTVAGSLPGQGWDGIANETALKNIFRKYGQVIFFNGHSHWELNSECVMFPGDEETPVAFDTAALGYLWGSYNTIGGEFVEGSHGYYVRVYDDKVIFIGRDFENGLWIPSAVFVIEFNTITSTKDEYTVTIGSDSVNVGAKAIGGGELSYLSTNTAVANVTVDGTIVPKKVGETEVVVTSFDTGTKVSARKRIKVTVKDVARPNLIAIYNSAKGADFRFSKVEPAVAYKIMRKENGVWSCIATVKPGDLEINGDECKYFDETVADKYGKGFIYSVAAVLDGAETDYDTLGLPLYRLAKPEITDASRSGDTSITVTWKKVDAHGYELQYSADKGKTWVKVPDTKETTVTLENMDKSITYYFRLRDFKDNADRGRTYSQFSDWASEARIVVPVLANIYNSANGGDIRWKPDSNKQYVIMRKENGVWKEVKTVNAADLEKDGGNYKYIDGEVKNSYGKGYIYSVAVKDKNGKLYYDTKGLALYRLDVPTIKSAKAAKQSNGKYTITLEWKKVDAHGYEVQYSTDGGKTWAKLSQTTDTKLELKDLDAGKQYVFRVRCQKTNKDRGTTWSQYTAWQSVKTA